MQETVIPTTSSDLNAKFEDWKATAESSIRAEPLKTAGLALGAGFVLSILPLGRLIGSLLQVALALVRPALLIFGVIKLVEELDKQKQS